MNKKFIAPLFVLSSFLLIGCASDTIVARPSWMDDAIIDSDGIKNNTLKEVYDAIKKLSDTNVNVLNRVMYEIAKKQIGSPIEDVKDNNGNITEVSLFTIVNDKATTDQLKGFINKHPIYKSEDFGYKLEGGNTVRVDYDDNQKLEVSKKKIFNQYKDIIERIFEKLYNEIKGDDYLSQFTKVYNEQLYIDHLTKELYAPDTTNVNINSGYNLINGKPFDKTWLEFVNNNGTSNTGYVCVMDQTDPITYKGNFTKVYYNNDNNNNGGYIGRKLLPEIYRTLLIESYVREQRYSNLGRSYARKIKMIAIPKNDNVNLMLKNYVQTHITGNKKDKLHGDLKVNLEDLNQAMIGAVTTTDPTNEVFLLLEGGKFSHYMASDNTNPVQLPINISLDGHYETPSTTYVYKGTKIGDVFEKLNKCTDITYDTSGKVTGYSVKGKFTSDEQTAYEDLTNKGTYPIDVGLDIKIRECFNTHLYQEGWYLKSGGISELAEKYREYLFSINISNILDNPNKKGDDKWEAGESAMYFTDGNNKMGAFLIEGSDDKEPWNEVVLRQHDPNNYYIVQIEEAASSAKLSVEDADRSYLISKATSNPTDSNQAMDEIVRNVAKKAGEGDTYKSNAEQYYLMISNIVIHDQGVYDYFKSQFPDLFK